MFALILSILISLGHIGTADDFNNLSAQDQNTLTEIVIEELEIN